VPSSSRRSSQPAAVHGPHQQLDVHPRDLRPAPRVGHRRTEESDLDLRPATAKFIAGRSRARPASSSRGRTDHGHARAGLTLSERNPDYVVLARRGRTASRRSPARSGSSRRARGSSPRTLIPAARAPGAPCRHGAVAALIQAATNRKPYFVGKPNPFMMRSALRAIDAHAHTTMMVGDRWTTDVISGLEAGLRTILVLTGSTKPNRSTRSVTGRPRGRLHRRCGPLVRPLEG